MKTIILFLVVLLFGCTKKDKVVESEEVFIQIEVEYKDSTTDNSIIYHIR